MNNTLYKYLSDRVSFISHKASLIRTIYAPLAGTHSESIKSSITPFLAGDIKIDKNRYLTKPVSAEDLRTCLRNFFCFVEGQGLVSIAEESEKDSSYVEFGQLWHKLVRNHRRAGLELEALNFVPVTGENVELMRVTAKNFAQKNLKFTPTFSVPLFARALANKHDHEHVTSLLHRIEQLPNGVLVQPSMVFDESGHKPNETVYYVLGTADGGENPVGSFPTVDSFYGESGTPAAPEAVVNNLAPTKLNDEAMQGKEAFGALRFKEEDLAPGESREYFVVMGIGSNPKEADSTFNKFNSSQKFDEAFKKNKEFWLDKSQSIRFHGGNKDFHSWMRWVTIQPVLRRIFGCSFLPDHDYGKGGKGWRDIWQDMLSLILIEPENIGDHLINYFAGVRIDGSNATIVGSAPGEYIADRNAIPRVWMDHGAWPLMTLLLYIQQTGDFDILLKVSTYFKDSQLSRTFEKDDFWRPEYGNKLKDKNGNPYRGSLIEHILVQHLVQFFNVGEHNIARLESADWNDGLDMAASRGESVAFMSLYGGNLLALADLLEQLSKSKGIKDILLAKEVMMLLDSLNGKNVDYAKAEQKKRFLFETYFQSVQPEISGRQIKVKTEDVVKDLRRKGNWIFSHIRDHEKIKIKKEGHDYSWFNGYYDNKGARVEGENNGRVRMTLTGQVFPIMTGLASDQEIREIVHAVNRYLKDRALGGIRLNTDFGLRHYLDLGRAFGFAYGTKENGAFFSHMTVMYAYALYKRGFAREGYEVLRSIYRMGMDTEKSKIYPGVPEYFDSEGRGRYHYLTGSASWLVLTLLTQAFGVRGQYGDLVLAPLLVKEEFDEEAKAGVSCTFAGKKLSVVYVNEQRLDYEEYEIKKVFLNDRPAAFESVLPAGVKIKRECIQHVPADVGIRVVLGALGSD